MKEEQGRQSSSGLGLPREIGMWALRRCGGTVVHVPRRNRAALGRILAGWLERDAQCWKEDEPPLSLAGTALVLAAPATAVEMAERIVMAEEGRWEELAEKVKELKTGGGKADADRLMGELAVGKAIRALDSVPGELAENIRSSAAREQLRTLHPTAEGGVAEVEEMEDRGWDLVEVGGGGGKEDRKSAEKKGEGAVGGEKGAGEEEVESRRRERDAQREGGGGTVGEDCLGCGEERW